jgi:hypothetical protein
MAWCQSEGAAPAPAIRSATNYGLILGQDLVEALPGAVNDHFCGANGDTKHLGHFGRSEAQVTDEIEGQCVAWLQPSGCVAESSEFFADDHRLIWSWVPVSDVGSDIWTRDRAPGNPDPAVVDGCASGDREQPRPKPLRLTQGVEAFERSNEDLLRDVFGVGSIRHVVSHDMADQWEELAIEKTERANFAVAGSDHQAQQRLVAVGRCHQSPQRPSHREHASAISDSLPRT